MVRASLGLFGFSFCLALPALATTSNGFAALSAMPNASLNRFLTSRERADARDRLLDALKDNKKADGKDVEIEIEIDGDDLQAFYEAAFEIEKAEKAGKGKDETEEAFKKRIATMTAGGNAKLKKVSQQILASTGQLAGSIASMSGGSSKEIVVIYVGLVEGKDGKKAVAALAKLTITLEVKAGKEGEPGEVTGIKPSYQRLPPPKEPVKD